MSFKATYRTRAFAQGTPKASRTRAVPTMRYENALRAEGAELIAGVDEVGVGAWAGPVAVGVVVLHPGRRLYKVRDSKLLDAPRREWLASHVQDECLSWSVGLSWPREIDEMGLSAATRLAGNRAVEGLTLSPDAFLVDGNWNLLGTDAVTTIVRGDSESVSIASASLVAKVARDRLMRCLAPIYPQYLFESNKGYPSELHKRALAMIGPSPIHRRLFEPVRKLVDESPPCRLLPAAGSCRPPRLYVI
jgi:ribonuclease HII